MNTERDPEIDPELAMPETSGEADTPIADFDAKGDIAAVAREISSDDTSIDGSEKGLIYPGPGA